MSFTPEQRVKALAARKAAVANNPYRTDWADADFWASLARKRALRLPAWHIPPTPIKLKRWHGSLDKEPWALVFGDVTPSELIRLNPRTPLRAFVGMMLERLG